MRFGLPLAGWVSVQAQIPGESTNPRVVPVSAPFLNSEAFVPLPTTAHALGVGVRDPVRYQVYAPRPSPFGSRLELKANPTLFCTQYSFVTGSISAKQFTILASFEGDSLLFEGCPTSGQRFGDCIHCALAFIYSRTFVD